MNFKKIQDYIFPIFAGVLLVLWLQQCNKDPEIIEIPVEIEVEVPVVEKVHDTVIITEKDIIHISKPDTLLLKKYLDLKDQAKKDSLFKESIRIVEYNKPFSDDFQKVGVYSKVRGVLLEQSVDYKTKPKTIIVRDTIKIENKNKFYIGAELGIPTIPTLNSTPVLKGGFVFQNKKGNTFSLSYDTEGRVWAGKTFKIFK